MAFWKKWWKKKNEAKKGAEYEDHPLPSEVEGTGGGGSGGGSSSGADEDPQLEHRIRARRNNLSVSRSGRFKAKGKERGQVVSDLFQQQQQLQSSPPPGGRQDAAGNACTSAAEGSCRAAPAADHVPPQPQAKGSFGKNSCREAQLALRAGGASATTGPISASIH